MTFVEIFFLYFVVGTMLSSGNSADQGSLHGSNIVQYGQDGNVYVPGKKLS
jgi:hypothetical protein